MNPPDVTLSVIICTRNRADSLKLTLASLAAVIAPKGWEVELIIVDNGSTDHTRMIGETAGLTNLAVRLVTEPIPGLSQARNTGLREARGEIIAFTDDDVRVPPRWLIDLSAPLVTGIADAVVGGVVIPPHLSAALAKPPLASRHSCFASTEELDRDHPTAMVGANMAFHRRVLAQVPAFDTELGAGALGFGEETLFSLQLRAAGYRIVGAWAATVEHHFDATRLNPADLIALARKIGRTNAFMAYHWYHEPIRFPRLQLLRYAISRRRPRLSALVQTLGPADALARNFPLEQRIAFYREYLVQRRRPRKYSSPDRPTEVRSR